MLVRLSFFTLPHRQHPDHARAARAGGAGEYRVGTV